jgi:hypothetical protein
VQGQGRYVSLLDSTAAKEIRQNDGHPKRLLNSHRLSNSAAHHGNVGKALPLNLLLKFMHHVEITALRMQMDAYGDVAAHSRVE